MLRVFVHAVVRVSLDCLAAQQLLLVGWVQWDMQEDCLDRCSMAQGQPEEA
jgi:hypothetical protein